MNVHEHDYGECVGMYAVRVDVDGLQTRQPRAVCRGEAAAVLERTVRYRTGKLRPKLNVVQLPRTE